MELSKENIKKKIAGLEKIKDVLFYLDVVEKEVNDRISELYIKTRMNDYGDFLGGENGWEFAFESRKFDPEFMMTPPLTTNQQEQYINDYGKEIKEAEYLHNIDSFIKDQKKFYEKQLVKYALMENGEKKIETENEGIQINYDCYNFDFNKIKKYAENLDLNKATLYLKYVLKEFDREKRENELLFLSEEDIEYSKKEFNRLINDNEYANVNLWGIGEKQKNLTKNFEINIQNEIKFLQDKNNLKLKNEDVININETAELKKILDIYYEYGKECYLLTWKDELQLLTFEKKMVDKYGTNIKQHIYHLYKYISKKTNPIEFIGCDYGMMIKNYDRDKIKNEINRVAGYISELEKLKFFTDDENNSDKIPEDDLGNYDEWQCYYIEQIKYKELAEWVEILRKNRPSVTDYKYGEFYPIEFSKITKVALNEIKIYKEKLETLILNTEIKTKNKRKKIKISSEIIAEEVIKQWGNGVEEFEEIYNNLSDNSEKIFGQKLTPGQIKGRYQRYAKKHKDFKREKYK